MSKRTVTGEALWAMGVLLVLASVIAFSPDAARAVETPVDPAMILSKISGQVLFEKRSTIVPLFASDEITPEGAPDCGFGIPCPVSTTYWSLVVANGDARYEFDRAFDNGQDAEPEYLRINNVDLRPGFNIEVDGTVEELSPDYGVISQVQNIRLVVDRSTVDNSDVAPDGRDQLPNFGNGSN